MAQKISVPQMVKDFLTTYYEWAPLGFESSNFEAFNFRLKISTIIIGDEPLMEIMIFVDNQLEFWRVTEIHKAYHDACKFLDMIDD
jgi:hypothetical protein